MAVRIGNSDSELWDLTGYYTWNGLAWIKFSNNGTTNQADTVTGNGGDDTISGGGGNDTLDGGDGNDTLDGGTGNDLMRGGDGNDTYVVDSTSDVVDETDGSGNGLDLGGTDLVKSSVTFTLPGSARGRIENLTLTGSANINGTGNEFNNVITGNSGNNTLAGGAGADTLDGGGGTDTASYANSSAGVSVSLFTGTGSGGDAEGDTLTNIENLTGSGKDDWLEGDTNNNVLNGGAGTDTVSYAFATSAVTVNLSVTSQQDTVGAGKDTLSNFENLTGSDWNDTLTGSSGNNVISGGKGDDTINGGAGTDTLDGGIGNDTLDGGTGADTMTGGDGNDTYVVDDAGDKVNESGTSGIDLVKSSTTFDLSASQVAGAVENLTLTGSSNINGTGTDLDNVMTGNTGANTLSGGKGNDTLNGGGGNDTLDGGDGNDTLDGGTGADKMSGGAGNDTYVVDNAGDVVNENGSDSNDLVKSSISFSLITSGTVLGSIENLTLAGTANINGTGNELDNVITGNTGNNTLDGGKGVDTLDGGEGNDTLIGGVGADKLDGEAGTDTASYASSSVGVSVSLFSGTGSGGDAEGDTLTKIENLTGSGKDDWLEGDTGNNVLNGGAGIDTVSYAYIKQELGGSTLGVTVDLSKTTVQDTGIGGIDTLLNFENLTGSERDDILTGNSGVNLISGGKGNDTIIGGGGNDTLDGGEGNDSLDGGTGNDKMLGGTGNDTYVVDSASDVVDETDGSGNGLDLGGTDLVKSSVTFTLPGAARGQIENLTLTGIGNINGTGNEYANVITGNSGNNTLDGGAGDDSMYGGAGNDTYIVDSTSDVVNETGGDGVDLVKSSVNYTLAGSANGQIENLTLTGNGAINGTGNEFNNIIIGNSAANMLVGGDGDDTLDGGTGADTLYGGNGSDTYIVDNAADKVDENGADNKIDLVKSSVTYTLGSSLTYGAVENLMLTGSSSINGTGNELDNVITGNSGNNVLAGLGGRDKLDGGTGTDTASYASSSVGVKVSLFSGTGSDGDAEGDTLTNIENLTGSGKDDWLEGDVFNNVLNGGAGTDTVSYAFATSGVTVNLSVTSQQDTVGAGKDTLSNFENLTGSDWNDTLTGSSGNNVISGGKGDDTINGGGGADTLIGGDGNDTYAVDNAGDKVNESGNNGNDLVKSSVNFSLAGPQVTGTVENLTLTGSSNVNGTGNDDANIITGNTGNNTLTGNGGNDTLIGGLGADTLNGGSGNDIFVYLMASESAASASNGFSTTTGDTLTSFSSIADNASEQDKIDLSGVASSIGHNLVYSSTAGAEYGVWTSAGTGNITYVNVDTTGDGKADMVIRINSKETLSAADFIGVNSPAPQITLGGTSASIGLVITGESPDDATGYRVSGVGDVNGDGFADVIVGAPFHDGSETYAGAAYIVFGNGGSKTVNLSGSPTGVIKIEGTSAYDLVGWSVSSAGDVNGDGFGDIIIGTPYGDSGGANSGTSYVIFGGAALTTVNLDTLEEDGKGFAISGDADGDYAGWSVSSAGDVNGDGFDDLIIGAPYAGGDSSGKTYVVFGGISLGDIDLANLDSGSGFVISDTTPGDSSGWSVSSAGDVNGDGFDDLIVGVPYGSADAGDVYVVFGSESPGPVDLSSLKVGQGIHIKGTTGSYAGWSVSSAGDVNGDGYDDIIIGAPYGSRGGTDAGEAYVIFGGTTMTDVDLADLKGAGFVIQGDKAGDFAGWSVSSAGDVNGDGFDDLLVGVPYGDRGGADAGATYVVFESATPVNVDLTTLGASQGLVLLGGTGSYAGMSVSAAGDVNGDGYDDLIVGAPGSAQSFVVLGSDFTGKVSISGTPGADILIGSATDDDLSGLGGADVLRSGAGDDNLTVLDASFFHVDGGTGHDTLEVAGSNQTFDFTELLVSKVESIEEIDLGAGNNSLTIDALGVIAISDDRVDGVTNLAIHGDNGEVTLVGDGWTSDGPNAYVNNENAHVRVIVDSGVAVVWDNLTPA
jgi:Ca2+-binding RTX toxin-like protein